MLLKVKVHITSDNINVNHDCEISGSVQKFFPTTVSDFAHNTCIISMKTHFTFWYLNIIIQVLLLLL